LNYLIIHENDTVDSRKRKHQQISHNSSFTKRLENLESSEHESNSPYEQDISPPSRDGITDLQGAITQAILTIGEPCTFEQIYEYVHSVMSWRRDGTRYNSDCRRAILAILRSNPTTMKAFKVKFLIL